MILDDDYVLPFSEVLDWTQASVRCWSHDMVGVASQLRDFPQSSIREMRERVRFLYDHYFSSLPKIAMAVLDIINKRIFPLSARGSEVIMKSFYIYAEYNNVEHVRNFCSCGQLDRQAARLALLVHFCINN